MRSIIIIFMLLIVLPAWAGTFRDDFEDGNLDGWTTRNLFGNGEWTIQDGKLSGWNENGTSAIFMEPSEWKDYTLEASVCLLEKRGNAEMEMSLTVRSAPQSLTFYGFCLQFAGGKYPDDQI